MNKMKFKLALSSRATKALKAPKELNKLMTFLFDKDHADMSDEVSEYALPYFKQIKEDLKDRRFKATFYATLLQINSRRANGSSGEVHLTPREVEIVEMLLKGYKYSQMSSEFNVSMDTIFTHIRHIYKKLEVCSRSEMASKILYCNAALFALIFNFLWS
jgi:ATP/maltotriose-dependent transcriptional regulator MalT